MPLDSTYRRTAWPFDGLRAVSLVELQPAPTCRFKDILSLRTYGQDHVNNIETSLTDSALANRAEKKRRSVSAPPS